MSNYEYNKALQYIHSLGMYSKKKAVDMSKMKYLCTLFGNPQDCFGVIHIAGTNGKGSATAMLHNIVRELGYKAGRYISPFIRRFNERISVDGTDISDSDLPLYTNAVREKVANLPEDLFPNEFEFVTLMAFLYYKDCNCDIVVLETGLGGRLDPTNAVKKPLASVIMSIDLDHIEILGDTIEKIAGEKCGIIKHDAPLTVLYPLNAPTVIELVKNTAQSKNNLFAMPDTIQTEIIHQTIKQTRFRYKDKEYTIKLIGEHQVYNAVTVIETVLALTDLQKLTNKGGHDTIYSAIHKGIAITNFPARFEVLSTQPLIIFDGAHNISAVNTLSKNISSLLRDKKVTLLCGMLRDKNPRAALQEILRIEEVERFIAVPVNSIRAMPPEELCRIAADLEFCKDISYTNNLASVLNQFLDEAPEKSVMVCFGSLFLAGDLKSILGS